MKKTKIAILCMLSLFMLALAGNVAAYKEGYSHTVYAYQNAVTIDGTWTSTTEWEDGNPTTFGTAVFRDKWQQTSTDPVIVYQYAIMESSDITDDSGDYWQICLDGSADGGAAPQTDDFKIEIRGHGNAAVATWFKGTGTNWASITPPSATTFQFSESLSASPTNSTAHYILEMKLQKTSTELGGAQIISATFCMRAAYNDANAGGSGLQAWPPTSADVPNDYGNMPYDSTVYPESLSIILVLALSSVAVIAGSVLLRKRSIANSAIKPTATTP